MTNEPMRPTAAEIDAMPEARVKYVLTHNEYGAARCGWTK